jgi:large subunit ribosomal protein L2
MFDYFFKVLKKKFRCGKMSKGGRNFFGRICVHHRGGGLKKNYIRIDFMRRVNQWGYILKTIYDPNRSAFISLIIYLNGLSSFIIAIDGLDKHMLVFSGYKIDNVDSINKGSALTIASLPLFSVISNIENKPFNGSTFVRAGGCSALIIGATKKFVIVKLGSGWQLNVLKNCMAVLGSVSNDNHTSKVLMKAGTNRNLGIRPTVRGLAKNPCDHPHGGGNGKKSPPRMPVSAWGRFTKWVHSNNKKKDRQKRRFFKNLNV